MMGFVFTCLVSPLAISLLCVLGRKIKGKKSLSYIHFVHPHQFSLLLITCCHKVHLLAEQTLRQAPSRKRQLFGQV